jgi:DNA-binding transcriptional LysR family regulator
VILATAPTSGTRRYAVVPVDNGQAIVVTGKIGHYGPQGSTQLYATKMEPQGVGLLEQRFQALVKELREKGYFEESRKKPLPAHPRRVALVTSAAGAALQDVIKTARELRAGRHAPVAIACVTSALFDFLPPLVRGLQAALPEAAVGVREMDTADALDALRRGEVDLALLRGDRDAGPIRLLPLGQDHLCVALPEGHALLAGPDPLPLGLLAEAPMLALPRAISPAYADAMTAACHEAGFMPRTVREVGSAMAQLGFVAAGLGVALVSSGMARLRPPGVAFRMLAGPIRAVGVALAWHVEREGEVVERARALAAGAHAGG